ncbi:hypothetical protein [Beihai picorna-like virus 111]|uniref:hypothetical protein n=1 Tax=Beihai picorna-like virus 111 TaxID=1922540 RepID=UPI00090C8A1D|nr:hypothetical protein [Beihai picorna-like virus 111]APG76702.1 hypothetical protein [Beihai picorna-like virus 111]APG78906.1 hypothetical protein [Beihai picorna-like virus 111]
MVSDCSPTYNTAGFFIMEQFILRSPTSLNVGSACGAVEKTTPTAFEACVPQGSIVLETENMGLVSTDTFLFKTALKQLSLSDPPLTIGGQIFGACKKNAKANPLEWDMYGQNQFWAGTYEEPFKKLGPVAFGALVGLEFAVQPTLLSKAVYIPTALMHTICYNLPLKLAIPAHMMWNYYAVRTNAFEYLRANAQLMQDMRMRFMTSYLESQISWRDLRLECSLPERLEIARLIEEREYTEPEVIRLLAKSCSVDGICTPQGLKDAVQAAQSVAAFFSRHGNLIGTVVNFFNNFSDRLTTWFGKDLTDKAYITVGLLLGALAIKQFFSATFETIYELFSLLSTIGLKIAQPIVAIVQTVFDQLSKWKTQSAESVSVAHVPQGAALKGSLAISSILLSTLVPSVRDFAPFVLVSNAMKINKIMAGGVRALSTCASWFPEILQQYLIGAGIYTPLDLNGHRVTFSAMLQTAAKMVVDAKGADGNARPWVRPGFAEDFGRIYRALYINGPKVLEAFSKDSPERLAYNMVMKDMKAYTANVSQVLNSRRPKPASFYLFGQPGVGKTVVTNALTAAMCPDVPNGLRAFYRNTDANHWDGYFGQPVLIDEDWQASGVTESFKERVAESLRIMSGAPFIPTAARVEDKGMTITGLRGNIYNSNYSLRTATWISKAARRAFGRRVCYLEVETHPNFRTRDGKVDYAKVNALPLHEKAEYPHIRLVHYENLPDHNWRKRRSYTVKQIMVLAARIMLENFVEYRSLNEVDHATDVFVLRNRELQLIHGQFLEMINEAQGKRDGTLTLEEKSETDDEDGKTEYFDPQGIESESDIPFPVSNPVKHESGFFCPLESSCQRCLLLGTAGAKICKKNFQWKRLHSDLQPDQILEKFNSTLDKKLAPEDAHFNFKLYDDFVAWLDLNGFLGTGNLEVALERALIADEDEAFEIAKMEHRNLPFSQRIAHVWSPSALLEYTVKKPQPQPSTYSKFEGMVNKIRELSLPFSFSKLGTILGFIGSASALAMLWANIPASDGDSDDEEPIEPETVNEAQLSSFYKNELLELQRQQRHLTRVAHRPQISVDDMSPSELQTNFLVNKFGDHSVRIERQDSNAATYSMYGIVNGEWLIAPRHFYNISATDDQMIFDGTEILVKGKHHFSLKFKASDLQCYTIQHPKGQMYRDISMFPIPKAYQQKKLRDGHLATMEEIKKGFDQYFLINKDDVIPIRRVRLTTEFLTWGGDRAEESGFQPQYSAQSFLHYRSLHAGSCGTMLVGVSPGRARILSMHVLDRQKRAGPIVIESEGTGILMCQGPVNIPQVFSSVEEKLPEIADSFGLPMDQFIGSPLPLPNNPPARTRFIKSGLPFKTKRAPAYLGALNDPRSTLGPRDLMMKEHARGHANKVKYTPEELKDHVDYFVDMLKPHCRGLRKLTLDEAINGSEELGVPPIVRRTSAGYPLNCATRVGFPGKLSFFSITAEDKLVPTEELLEHLARDEKDRREGKNPTFGQCFLKDELRPIEKTQDPTPERPDDQVKTRVVVGTPLTHQLQLGQLVKHLIAIIISLADSGHSALGIDVGSTQWHDLIGRLKQKSAVGFAGDFKKFESYFTVEFADALAEAINRLYDDEEQDQIDRRDLLRNAVEAQLIFYDVVFRDKNGTNPSGLLGTTALLNFFLVSFLIRLGFKDSAKAAGASTLGTDMNFWRSIDYSSLGDDHIVASPYQWFNFYSMKKSMEERGVQYTYAIKTIDNPPELEPLEDLPFLGGKTVVRGGMRFHARPKEDILDSLAWISNTLPPNTAIYMKCNCALEEMWAYGRPEFETLRRRLSALLIERNITQPLVTWSDMETRYYKKPSKPVHEHMELMEPFSQLVFESVGLEAYNNASLEDQRVKSLVATFFSVDDDGKPIIDEQRLGKILTTEWKNVPQGLAYSKSANGAVDFKANIPGVSGTRDKPNHGVDHIRVVEQAAPEICSFAAGATQAQVMDDHPARKAVATPQDYGTTQSETSIEYLFGRNQLVQRGFFDTQAVQDISVVNLVPNPIWMEMTAQPVKFHPTLQGYISSLFQYWRCDFEITVTLALSKFHTIRLALCTHVGGLSTDVTNIEDALGQYGSVCDFSEANPSHSIYIPFQARTEQLKVPTLTAGTYGSPEYWLRSMGQFSLRVVNTLQAPETVSPEIEYFIFFRCKNVTMSFVKEIDSRIRDVDPFTTSHTVPVPMSDPDYIGTLDPPIRVVNVPQVGEEKSEVEKASLIASAAPVSVNSEVPVTDGIAEYSASPTMKDTSITDLGEICKRQSPIYWSLADDIVLNAAMLFTSTGVSSQGNGGHMRYLSKLFRFWKGSQIWTNFSGGDIEFSFCSDASISTQKFKRSAFGSTTNTSYQYTGCSPFVVSPVGKGVQQMKLPFNSQFHVLYVPFVANDIYQATASSGFIYGRQTGLGDSKAGVFAGAGDDFTMGFLFKVPEIEVILGENPPPFRLAEQPEEALAMHNVPQGGERLSVEDYSGRQDLYNKVRSGDITWKEYKRLTPLCTKCKALSLYTPRESLCDFCSTDLSFEHQGSYVTIHNVPQVGEEEAVDEAKIPEHGISVVGSDATAIVDRPIAGHSGEDVMPEIQLLYTSILERRQFFGTFEWTTTQSHEAIAHQFELPYGMIKGNALKRAFESFLFWRPAEGTPAMRIHFQLQSQPFQAGILIAYFVPGLVPLAAKNSHEKSHNSKLLCPHVFMHAGSTSQVSLDIPFVHVKKWLETQRVSTETLGTLFLQPWSQLRVADTAVGPALQAQVSIFISFPSPQLKVLRSQDG